MKLLKLIAVLTCSLASSQVATSQPMNTFANEDDLIARLRSLEQTEYTTDYSYTVLYTSVSQDRPINMVIRHTVSHKQGSATVTSELQSNGPSDDRPKSSVYTRSKEAQFLITAKNKLTDGGDGVILKKFDQQDLEAALKTEKQIYGSITPELMPLSSFAAHRHKGLLSDFLTEKGFKILSQEAVDGSVVVKILRVKQVNMEIKFLSVQYPIVLKMKMTDSGGSEAGMNQWNVERKVVETKPGVYRCESMESTHVLVASGQNAGKFLREYSDYSDRKVDDTEFGMEKYGFPTPVDGTPPKRIAMYVWILGAGAAFAIIAFAFRRLSRKRAAAA